MATPLFNIPTRYSTRRNSEGVFDLIPKPERAYRRRLNRQTSRSILQDLGSQSLSDIHHLFVESHIHQSQEMTYFFKPLDLSQIAGAPHAIPNDAIKKLPTFEANNTITAKSHLKKFERLLVRYCNDAAHDHDDVKMKLFALSLEEDVGEWYLDLADNSYKTLKEFLDGFRKKWGEKKEPRHQLGVLHNIKKMENETMEEFNKKFRDLVSELHKGIKPHDVAILIYYIEAFTGNLRYQ